LMQMKDPYMAARSALSAVQIFGDLDDKKGMVEALAVAAEAHLIYDPESALKIAKDGMSASDEIGDVNEVAKRLIEDVVPKGAPQEVIKAESKMDREGRRQDIIEYRYQWKFDKDMAARLGRKKFQLHCKAERKICAIFQASPWHNTPIRDSGLL